MSRPGEWRVSMNFFGGDKWYTVYRIRDLDQIDHNGNREYHGEYMLDRDEALAIAERLNKEEKNEQ